MIETYFTFKFYTEVIGFALVTIAVLIYAILLLIDLKDK